MTEYLIFPIWVTGVYLMYLRHCYIHKSTYFHESSLLIFFFWFITYPFILFLWINDILTNYAIKLGNKDKKRD